MPSPRTPSNALPHRFTADQDNDEITDDFARAGGESDADDPTDSTAPAYAKLPDLDQYLGTEGMARENTSEALFGSVRRIEPKPLEDPPTLSDRDVQMNLRQVVENSRFEERTSRHHTAPARAPSPSVLTIGLVAMGLVLVLAAVIKLLA